MDKSASRMEYLNKIMAKVKNCEELYAVISACTNLFPMGANIMLKLKIRES